MTTEAITPLRQRMIEDMNARKLCAGTQRGHILSCKRFAGFHRIRHYGLLAKANHAANIARARKLLAVPLCSNEPKTPQVAATEEQRVLPRPCPCCGGRMIIIETFARGCEPKRWPTPASHEIRIDTS
jgi:hypothetical protein